MPRPTSATTIQRPDLAAVVSEFADDSLRYIGLQVMPPFPVAKQSADYPVFPREAFTSVPDTKRAMRAAYKRGDWEFETDTYACVEHGWEEPVDDVERALYSRFFDAELAASKRARGIILRTQEKRIADMLFNAGNFTAHAITHEWDDGANAVPITDVKAAKKAIHDLIGLEPNTLIIAYSTFLDLGLVTQLVDRIKYTNPAVQRGNISTELLAQAFGVKQLLVGDSMYNTAKQGQVASMAGIWDKEYAMLCHISESPDLTEIPCIGRTFVWTEDSADNFVVESYREEQTRSDVIRVRQHTDEELIAIDCAYLLSNITT
jgi:hypothetical protein